MVGSIGCVEIGWDRAQAGRLARNRSGRGALPLAATQRPVMRHRYSHMDHMLPTVSVATSQLTAHNGSLAFERPPKRLDLSAQVQWRVGRSPSRRVMSAAPSSQR